MPMSAGGLLALLALFQLKHLLADFFWQTEAMVKGKGTYGNVAGASHSAVHASLSLGILLVAAPISVGLAIVLAVAEFLLHYHTDWAKDQFQARGGYTPKQKVYWQYVGMDQYLHQMTYVGMIAVVLLVA